MSDVARSRLTARTVRLIASRFPPIGVFDDITGSEADLRAAFELEELTNTRLMAAARLRQIPGGEVAHGAPGASLIMAAFLHASESGGRFTDGRLGGWYAATEIEVALAETVYHHERRLRASAEGFPARIQMRELVAAFDAEFLDLRGLQASHPDLYHPNDYAGSQAFAAARRWPFATAAEAGVIYDSVRRPGGVNLCVWRPVSVPMPVEQGDHFDYVWDAAGKLSIVKLTSVAI
jgi:RES domain-containing protein